jgi:hypothetical protein
MHNGIGIDHQPAQFAEAVGDEGFAGADSAENADDGFAVEQGWLS